MQDEITEAATIAIAPAIAQAEQQRAIRRPPESLDAWAAYQRGLWHQSKASTEDNILAQKFFQQAIDLDPTFAGGYRGLAAVYLQAAAVFMTRNLLEAQTSAEALARRAVALDGSDAEARSCLSWVLLRRGDCEGALREAEHAISISPNLGVAHGALSLSLVLGGRCAEGLAAVERSLRLDPYDPFRSLRLRTMAIALYFSRDYSAAVGVLTEAIRSFPGDPTHYRWLAAALGRLDRNEEAREALTRAIAGAPVEFDLHVRERLPWFRPQDHEHMLEGLRKAGWQG